jgi:hypothetical protein
MQAVQGVSLSQAQAILRTMNVQAVVSSTPLTGMQAIYAGDGFAVHAVPVPAARVRIAYYLRAANGPGDALQIVTAPDFDPDRLAVIEGVDLAVSDRNYSALCGSGLFDRFSRRYRDANLGPIVISGRSICQYYTQSAIWAVNRSFNQLAEVTGAASYLGSANDPADVLGPFGESLRSAPLGTPVLLTDTSTHIRIAAPMEFAGYVVLADSLYPGWNAYVDGQPAPIVPANYAFRGVFVPIGQHIVDFRYEPGSVQIGGLVSSLAWLTLMLFVGLLRFVTLKQPEAALAPEGGLTICLPS